MQEFRSYDDFWPFYVGQHSKPLTRKFHLFGTLTAVAAASGLVATRRARFIPLLPIWAYGWAWTSHFAIEKNKPATFGHPLWSFRGDWQMIWYMVSGRDRELSEIAQHALAETPVEVEPAYADDAA